MRAPRRALILARISDADWITEPDGTRVLDRRGVDGQVRRLLQLAGRLGWTVGSAETHHVVENDTSAYLRRMVTLPVGPPWYGRREVRPYRPEYWRALQMLYRGEADGVLCIDQDRMFRDPRDLLDMTDVAERLGIPVQSVSTGELDFNTPNGRAQALGRVAHAAQSSADTSRRVAESRVRAAAAGEYLRSGWRKFGFEDDGVTGREDEAEEIRSWARDVLAGVSLRQLSADLRARGVLTPKGRPWTPESIRATLTNPRYAGFLVHRPLVNGRAVGGHVPYTDKDITGPAPWPAVVDEDTWRAVRAILLDPARNTTPGNTPKWLVSLIATCGVCGALVAVGGGSRIIPAYRCRERGEHCRVHAVPTDEAVAAVVTGRLAMPDAADLFPSARSSGPDVTELRLESLQLRERLDELGRMFAAGDIDGGQLKAGSQPLRARLAAVEAGMASRMHVSLIETLAGASDVAGAWGKLTIGQRRQVVRELCTPEGGGLTIRLHPMPKHARGFDLSCLEVRWLGQAAR